MSIAPKMAPNIISKKPSHPIGASVALSRKNVSIIPEKIKKA